MTPAELKSYLEVMRGANVMSAHLKAEDFELNVVLGPDFMPEDKPAKAPALGGWKQDPQDPEDPDPMGLGNLDAEFADPALE